jgi:hypothetical protein
LYESLASWSLHSESIFAQAVLGFDDTLEFSGFSVPARTLYAAIHQAESAFKPALALRDLLRLATFSDFAADASARITEELTQSMVKRKGSLCDVVAKIKVMRYMCGMDAAEFAALLVLVLPLLRHAFPRTPDDAPSGHSGLTLRLILFLCLTRLRQMVSLKFFEGLTGFSSSHLCFTLNKCEAILLIVLRPFLVAPTRFELMVDAAQFHANHTIGGLQFLICCMPDCTYYLMPRPLSDALQEVYYTGHKCIHALKLSIVGAVCRKWIHEVYVCLGRTADLTAWREQPFSKFCVNGLLAIADKGMNCRTELRCVTPYKKTQINQKVRQQPTAKARKETASYYIGFNTEVGSIRVLNENIIRDFTLWAAGRGSSSKKTFDDVSDATRRIELVRGLTNYVYRLRTLG